MSNEQLHKDELFINLTVDGTEYEDVEVKVTKPELPIREQIQRIIDVFELPKTDCGGHQIQYLLGQMLDDSEEPEILDFEDEDGHEQNLMDYNIQSGDSFHLISNPAYACPVPQKMVNEWAQHDMHSM